MSTEIRLTALPRTEFGKGASRRARAAGQVPAVLYGHHTDPRHFTVNAREFTRVMKKGANTVLTLDLGAGGSELALAKMVTRHPLRDYVEHVDLLLIRRGEKVTVDVQIIVEGDAAPGTMVLQDQTTLSIEVEALHIPDSLVVSIEGAEAGTQILAGDVKLPEGVTLDADPESLILSIAAAADQMAQDDEAEGEASGDGDGGADAGGSDAADDK